MVQSPSIIVPTPVEASMAWSSSMIVLTPVEDSMACDAMAHDTSVEIIVAHD
jgi:hypothetical protein